jgi:receptor expression-enhancing protein 5/6
LLANIIGFAYSAFCSIRALESTSKNDDTQWLTYRVVFAAFSVIEYLADLAGSVPVYGLVHAHHKNNGATIIYYKVILPFFKRHSSTIDRAIEKAENKATDIFTKALEEAKEVIPDALINMNKDD